MNTVFCSGCLKRGKEAYDLFEVLEKQIKKKGPTAKWELLLADVNKIDLNFNDECSETFTFEFDTKNAFSVICKIALEPGTDGQFEALFDMLYKAQKLFKEIKVSDDFGLAESYWNSKQYKFVFRELTEAEAERVKVFVRDGGKPHEEMLRSFMAEDMGMSLEAFKTYINPEIAMNSAMNSTEYPSICSSLESYLYETASFSGERLCEMDDFKYYDMGNVGFSVFAFTQGLAWIFLDGSGFSEQLSKEKKKTVTSQEAQIWQMYRDFFIPLYEASTGDTEKLMTVYRYFVSAYDFLGFRFEGIDENHKSFIDKLSDKYTADKCNLLLTCYCTAYRYIYNNSSLKRNLYEENFENNLKNKYGEEFWQEYLNFAEEYRINMRMMQIVTYYSTTKVKYIQDALVL